LPTRARVENPVFGDARPLVFVKLIITVAGDTVVRNDLDNKICRPFQLLFGDARKIFFGNEDNLSKYDMLRQVRWIGNNLYFCLKTRDFR
jgi:hypothetical protein